MSRFYDLKYSGLSQQMYFKRKLFSNIQQEIKEVYADAGKC